MGISGEAKLMNSLPSQRVEAIDYLKAIAIALVIITHSISKKTSLMLGGPFWIDMAVPIFMIISGYTYSISADRHNINTVKQWFSWQSISPKLMRIMLPYTCTVASEIVVFSLRAPISIKDLLIGYLEGGWGPGSYYFPMLIQLLIIFPLLLILFKKSPVVAVTVAFGVHLCFDVASNLLPISDQYYRLLILRYFAFIALGLLLYHCKKIIKNRRLLIVLAGLSATYIWMCNYYGYVPLIFSKWVHTSLPTAFWAFAPVLFGFRYLEVKSDWWLTKAFSIVGKASYHIFLIQMVYFAFGFGGFSVAVNLLINIITGVVFYLFEAFLLSGNTQMSRS